MIGSAFRKVWIPYSVYMDAFKQDEPQKAVVPVLHAVFPRSVLSCSAVIGNPQRGIQELSPNKLEAIRGAVFIVFNVFLLCTFVCYYFFNSLKSPFHTGEVLNPRLILKFSVSPLPFTLSDKGLGVHSTLLGP